jgi:carbon-monoxide dehydrogenase iron sulfur subunit
MRHVKPVKEFCIGCHLCELACLTEHSRSGDLILAYTKERPEEGLKACKCVHHKGPVAVAMSCQHCADPACVTACISGALCKDPVSGRTEYDREKCVGCWACVMACPFGAIRRHVQSGKIVKCDLCVEREIPACVAACPNQALVLVED